MRCFLTFVANTVLSVLAGFGIADAATAYDLPPLIYIGAGLLGGGFAGAAACAQTAASDAGDQPLALLPVIGQIGTLVVCFAALMAHLSPAKLKLVAIVLWILGLLVQAAAIVLMAANRRFAVPSKHPHQPDPQKISGA